MASPTRQTFSTLSPSAQNTSFPIPLYPVSENQDAPSITSSPMTDDGRDEQPGSVSQGTFYDDRDDSPGPGPGPLRPMSARPTTMSSVQETAPSHSRPSTAATANFSQRGGWSQPPSSRRSHQTSSIFGAGMSSGTGRPGSSTSRTSRTHVPSITSHAFFRPMSSQRLQAQRAGRSTTTVHTTATGDYSDAASNPQRLSIGSIPALPQHLLPQQEHELPPPSRGTVNTVVTQPDGPDRTTNSTSPSHFGTVRSATESVTPLQSRAANKGLALDQQTKIPPKTQRSMGSFRSSFLVPSRGTAQTKSSGQTREELSSTASSPRSATTKPQAEVKRNMGKNHQYFSGNTVFCWGGRLQNSRHRPINIITGLIVLIPGVLFLVFSAPWLGRNVSIAIPVLFGYVLAICLSSFVHASVTDPGILPRNLHPFPPSAQGEDPLTIGPSTTGWTPIKSFANSRTAMEVPIKYCKTCNIWRPPRAHHCRVCDNCIETQDHHCVWLNNCVGRRNYRYFFAFVASGTLIGLFLIGASLTHILLYRAREGITFGQAADQWRVPFAMAIFGVIATPYPAALWSYHAMLNARGETTREYLNSHKFARPDRHRPFSQGNMIKNWVAVQGRPRPPTYLHFKRQYEEGDQRFGPRRGKRQAPLKDEEQGGGGMEMEMSAVDKTKENPHKPVGNTMIEPGGDKRKGSHQKAMGLMGIGMDQTQQVVPTPTQHKGRKILGVGAFGRKSESGV